MHQRASEQIRRKRLFREGGVMSSYTIEQIERAINIWRSREAADNDAALCRPARALCEPYALLIISHKGAINETDLSTEQLEALRSALSPADAQ